MAIFNNYIIKNMIAKKYYYILLKVKYLNNNFFMLDCQILFKFKSHTDVYSFNKSRLIIINTILDIYGLDDN